MIFIRIHRMFTTVLQGIHDRNIKGTSCCLELQQQGVTHFEFVFSQITTAVSDRLRNIAVMIE